MISTFGAADTLLVFLWRHGIADADEQSPQALDPEAVDTVGTGAALSELESIAESGCSTHVGSSVDVEDDRTVELRSTDGCTSGKQ
jgi:hypothetical protein